MHATDRDFLCRQPQSFLGAVLRVPFVDFLTTMVRPDLLLTKHEYEEWGDPADPSALQLVRLVCVEWLVLLVSNVHGWDCSLRLCACLQRSCVWINV